MIEVAELVDARANRQSHPAEKDLVLTVHPKLVAISGGRGERNIENVPAVIAAVADCLARADERRAARLDIIGLGLEIKL